MEYIGKSNLRVDAYAKVTGVAKYTADLAPRDCLVAKVLQSTIANSEVINIYGYRVDDNVCISVLDNGVGMSQELIREVLNGEYRNDPESDKKHGNGVGLNNVIERLRLYYNGTNNFEIISNGRDQGTEVVITVPLAEEQDVSDNAGR